MINFETKLNAEKKNELIKIAEKALRHFDLEDQHELINITICRRDDVPSTEGGYCDEYLNVKVANSRDFDKVKHILLHEIAHVEQHIAGILTYDEEGTAYWKGVEMMGNIACIEAEKFASWFTSNKL